MDRSGKPLRLVISFLLAFLVASPLICDEMRPRKSRFVGTFLAAIPGYFVHGLGHWYAGDRNTALVLLGTEIIAIGLLAGADSHPGNYTNQEGRMVMSPDASVLATAGAITFVGGWAVGVALTPGAVERWNVAHGLGSDQRTLGEVFSGFPLRRPYVGDAPVPLKRDRSRLTAAVAEFVAHGVAFSDASIVSDWIRVGLVKAGRVNLIERKAMAAVRAEHEFQQTGCTTDECAVKLGRLLNAQRIVVGSVGRFLDEFVVNAAVVNVETGQVLYTESAKGRSSDELIAAIESLTIGLCRHLQ